MSAYCLPTYEPFSEYAAAATATGTNAFNLTTGTNAPSGEKWGALYFSGTAGTHLIGLDIDVTNMNAGSPFTTTALSSILPTSFPGYPSGSAITTFVVNPAQPLCSGNTITPSGTNSPNIVGNSAVLTFAQDITRPTDGTAKTLFWSYLFSVAQKGQTASGNIGRYLGFLASSNLNEGWIGNAPVAGAAYTNWSALFNTFGATTPKYFGHGVFNPGSEEIEPCDNSSGKDYTTPPTTFSVTLGAPNFIVGEYVFLPTTVVSSTTLDTNILWVNPAIGSFGGSTPPASPVVAYAMTNAMSDVGGLVLIDRVGSGAAGGVGTNYIANLLIGNTWSYVTGGPEFTNQPPASISINLGGNGSLSGAATAAGQSVSYQWVKITGGVTNNVNNGPGGAGGSATVSGANSSTMTLTGFSAGDVGNYQVVATASGTGYTLNSTTAALLLADPRITASPASATVNYGGSASFTVTATTQNAPLTYRWYLGATPLNNGTQPDGSYATGASGTTGAGTSFSFMLTLTNVSYQDIGSYTLYVTNTSSFENSSVPAMLSVNDPYVVTPPANPAVAVGGNVYFTVVAAGSPTVGYQWYEGATQLIDGGTTVGGSATVSGATTATLTLTGVQDADNGSYYCKITGSASGQTTNSAAATLTVQDPLTIVTPPGSLAERAGDHLAFFVVVSGGGPSYQWYAPNGNPISGATSSALVLTNIQTGSNGTYTVVVGNLATAPALSASATLTVINSAVLTLSPTNLVVTRVGDGVQALSGATGNTLYLDQYTTNGGYVNTIQIPDEGTGQPYNTGGASSANMPFGSPALLVAGSNVSPGKDAGYEAFLTRAPNGQTLNFVGYCEAYPFSGSDLTVGANGGPNWRGIGAVDAYGYYTLAWTNTGLCSGDNHQVHAAVDIDGNGTNFYVTGESGSIGIKYCNINNEPANGLGIAAVAGSESGTRVAQIIQGNVVFSDTNTTAASTIGIYACLGLPKTGASTNLLINEGNSPMDFAISPDLKTVYIADNGAFSGTSTQAGGIQRWDTNSASGGYTYSYTLGTGTGSTAGARGLTVDFSANSAWGAYVTGAILYATTAESSGNRLIKIADTGAASSATLLAAAGPNQILAGVRFGPAVILPSFASQPQNESALAGTNVTFSAGAVGSGPLTYQWYFQAGGVGAFNAILSATNATYTINAAGTNVGNYYVVVKNPGSFTAQSQTVSFTLTVTTPPQFTSETYLGSGVGFQLNFTGPAGSGYTIWTTTNVALPVTIWTKLTSSTFSGGTNTCTDTRGGANQHFYVISVP
jgi:hypothetical protein